MSTRRAARVSRATRTTRRTVEQQQLYLDQAAGDAFGGGGLHAGGVDAASGYYYDPSSSLSSTGQGAGGPGGGIGLGASYSSGAYSSRHLSRGKKPARKWILVQRPPAAGVGFRIDVWVPSDQLTEDEKATYLPPSKETNENVLVNKDAGADVAVPLASAPLAPLNADGAAADATKIDGAIVVDATAPTSLVAEVVTTSVMDEEMPQEPKENDAVEPSAPQGNVDVDMEEVLGAAPSSEGVADPTSPNDRPAKRARFAHPEDSTHDEQGDAAAESHDESQPPAPLMGPSEFDDDDVTMSTAVPSVMDSTGEASTMPPPPDDQSPADGSTQEASALSDAPHSEPPSAEEKETLSEDPSISRKRELEDISSATDGHVGGEDAQEPSESDGPPSKRARGSVDVDIETAASINCDLPAASDRSAISSASTRGDASVTVAVEELPVSSQQSTSESAKEQGGWADSMPSVEPESSNESR